MGLDMYALVCDPKKVIREEVAGLMTEAPAGPEYAKVIMSWRKHPDLHQWFTNLYFRKEGITGEATIAESQMGPAFNCGQFVRVTEHDLDQLDAAVEAKALPKAVGFFWGQSEPEDAKEDKAFIKKARRQIKKGKVVFYTSWW